MFSNATLVSATEYDYATHKPTSDNIATIVYDYNLCDAFYESVQLYDTDCTTADACQNGCGSTATKIDAHDIKESISYEA